MIQIKRFSFTHVSWFVILRVRKITFSLNDCVINYWYLVWNIYDLVDKCDHNTNCLVVEKGERRCMEQNANGDEILCGTKERESWKNNVSHMCMVQNYYYSYFISSQDGVGRCICVLKHTLCDIPIGKVEFSMYIMIVKHQSNFISKL
jgi:hypothetical protein